MEIRLTRRKRGTNCIRRRACGAPPKQAIGLFLIKLRAGQQLSLLSPSSDMPAPVVVYYVAALGTVAAVFALKQVMSLSLEFHHASINHVIVLQFIYDPHIAPAVGAWRESRAERRRESRARRGRKLVPVAVTSGTEPLDPSPRCSSLDRKTPDVDGAGISVEMENLVASETAEWQSSSQISGLRHRAVRPANVLEEV